MSPASFCTVQVKISNLIGRGGTHGCEAQEHPWRKHFSSFLKSSTISYLGGGGGPWVEYIIIANYLAAV